MNKLRRYLINPIVEFVMFVGWMISDLYKDTFDRVGLNCPELKNSIFEYVFLVIAVGAMITVCVFVVIGMACLIVYFLYIVHRLFYIYLIPVYALYGVLCFMRWLYIKKHPVTIQNDLETPKQ